MSESFRIAEICHSICGEGWLTGLPAVFIRFAGCNMYCTTKLVGFDCDTDHTCKRVMSEDEILTELSEFHSTWIVLTGGEPTLQLWNQPAFLELLVSRGYKLALETNGMNPVDRIYKFFSHLTVSPKKDRPCVIIHPSEIRLVITGEDDIAERICMYQHVHAQHHFLSPAWDKDSVSKIALENIINYLCSVDYTDDWRLCDQRHKYWNVR